MLFPLVFAVLPVTVLLAVFPRYARRRAPRGFHVMAVSHGRPRKSEVKMPCVRRNECVVRWGSTSVETSVARALHSETKLSWGQLRQRSRAGGLGSGYEALYVHPRSPVRPVVACTYRPIDLDGFGCWVMEDGTVINRKPIA